MNMQFSVGFQFPSVPQWLAQLLLFTTYLLTTTHKQAVSNLVGSKNKLLLRIETISTYLIPTNFAT